MDAESPEITWHKSLEQYISDTGEKCQGLAWMHKKAEAVYSFKRTFVDLPVIVMSGLVGFLNVGSTNIFGENQAQMSSITLGSMSLFVSILNSIGSYYSWGKRAEAHRISNLQYSRLYRDIVVELNLPRSERKQPGPMLKDIKDQFDRLQEISPLIPEKIISEFKRTFDAQTDISKPQETNGLHDIAIYPDDVATPSAFPVNNEDAEKI